MAHELFAAVAALDRPSKRDNPNLYSAWRKAHIANGSWAQMQVRRSPVRGQRSWRDTHLWYRYKLTPDDVVRIVTEQGGCNICGGAEPSGRHGWCVDHDHACCATYPTCGRCIRQVLCHRCNVQLGHDERRAAA